MDKDTTVYVTDIYHPNKPYIKIDPEYIRLKSGRVEVWNGNEYVTVSCDVEERQGYTFLLHIPFVPRAGNKKPPRKKE